MDSSNVSIRVGLFYLFMNIEVLVGRVAYVEFFLYILSYSRVSKNCDKKGSKYVIKVFILLITIHINVW